MYTYEHDREGRRDAFDVFDPEGFHFARMAYDAGDPDGAAVAEAKARLAVHRLNRHGELVRALHQLVEQTVDMNLRYGLGLSPAEEAARHAALAALERAVNVFRP